MQTCSLDFFSNGVSRKKYVDVPLSRDESLTCLLFNENRVSNNAFSSFVHVLSVRKLKRLINQPQRSLLKRFFLEDECV